MAHLELRPQGGGFDLHFGERRVMRHRPDAPSVAIGIGTPDIAMHRGNFDIRDRLETRIDLTSWHRDGDDILLSAKGVTLRLQLRDNHIEFICDDPRFNRLYIDLVPVPDEHIRGGGEQMSYLDLRGRRYPMWTSEPGVGRDKSSAFTKAVDRTGHAGGDYWTTTYPQPTFLSSAGYAVHIDTTAWSALDFTDSGRHHIEIWSGGARLELYAGDTMADLVGQLSTRFGRQPPLPDWAIEGAIIGLKDGENSFARLDAIIDAGAAVTGLWCEDWVGIRDTSFGARLFWDWQANPARYPDLGRRIERLAARGIRFLGYVNPYLAVDGTLFPKAAAAGYLARQQDDDAPYIVDFGEFDCGIVDLTKPEAASWFRETVLGRNMLDLGMAGWMADFGEYLPTDLRLADGSDPMLAHNRWPVIWAETNAHAIAERGREGDALFFMRAGYSGIGRHCPLLWAGDQSVDFSRHDGLQSAIRGALSAGLIGNAYHHSDIGGYTSLLGKVRSAELIQRWAEFAAFTPVMRTHEGNRPRKNLQIDSDPDLLAHFARMSRIHAALAPYTRALCRNAATTGLPLMRPLFLSFEEDPETAAIE
ncbi:MAG: alpha-glucosidase, partial [Pseudomonadota bacterium]